ncbi:unnamed protein product [Allacma fusca]|uniref:Gamma-aminobutyric acid receptor subunit beta n=1 Tax=Allacma fusca TaxID=39272 RepID=A0A8J2M2C0_9HEXA|nr:unnamed protein product [Allacma fusca]
MMSIVIVGSALLLLLNSNSQAGSIDERSSDEMSALSENITRILDSFKENYDKRVRPNYGGEAVEVGITMFVLSISSLSEVQMDFTVDFYFRQMWKDPRLQFQGPKGVKTLSVGSEFLESMWVPDTFFVNEKTSYFHTATTSNEFLRISSDGDILRSIRLTVTASCPMDLRHFPMDSQLCNIEIESFGYTMSDIRYKWAKGPNSVGVSNEVSLPQFKVWGYKQRAHEISLSTGNYSRLACEILFVRSMGYYLIQIYIPSSLIVVISWVSFWLNRNAAPARVYLGITTVLTMTTLMSSTNKALPKISYVKSIDVFLGTCFVMVFAALLEYATVGYLAKRIQMRKNHFAALQRMAIQLQTAREEHFHTLRQTEVRLKSRGSHVYRQGVEVERERIYEDEKIRQLIPINPNQICGITPSDIDKYSRVVFPVCFICFNLLYWIIYLHIATVNHADLVLLQQGG